MLRVHYWIIAVVFLSTCYAYAEQQPSNYEYLFNMTLFELMDEDVTVASGKKALPIRESPGIISIITREEILNSGASDLMTILQMVPGIEFGADVIGVVGITMRGNWAHEGKVMLMIDGIEMNHSSIGTTVFGNHYPVDNIQQIEVLRGPGSSMYGGNAELGVINIITQKGEDINGIAVTAAAGQMSDAHTHRNGSITAGMHTNNLDLAIFATKGIGNRSQRMYNDYFGSSYSMAENAEVNPELITIMSSYKGLEFKFIYDNFVTTQRDGLAVSLNNPYHLSFETKSSELSYDISLLKNNVIVTPKIVVREENSWIGRELPKQNDTGDNGWDPMKDETYYNIISGISVSYDLLQGGTAIKNVNILTGFEYVYDLGVKNGGDAESVWSNGIDNSEMYTLVGFAQGIMQTSVGNLTAGIRVENHEMYGNAIAPRIAYTLALEKLHTKVLYATAFNAPGLKTIELNSLYKVDKKTTLKPEYAKIAEFEAGYIFTSEIIATANLFYITITDPITFVVPPPSYENRSETGTMGAEIEFKYRCTDKYASLNYSYYTAQGLNDLTDYAVPGEDALVGTAQHKFGFNGNMNVYKGLSVNATTELYGERNVASVVVGPQGPEDTYTKQDGTVLADLFLQYTDFMYKGLTIGLGIDNIFDNTFDYIEPYNGWHAPIPGASRSYKSKISFQF